MKKLSIFLFFIISSAQMYAQKLPDVTSIDVAAAFGSGFSPALSYSKLWGVGKNGKFKIGTGVRYTGYFAGKTNTITAPAKLTSGETGPQVIFKENVIANIDTLQLNKLAVNYINIPIYLQYSFNTKLDIGFNIDAIGFSFGGSETGKYINTKSSKEFNATTQTAKPTNFNLLLVSDNDLGSLNSELYLRYWIKPKIGLRLGASFQFAEYTTDKKLRLDNDRFRAKNLLPFIAVSFKL